MTMYCIQNSQLKISINTLGAELKSVKDQDNGREYMWRADPQFWGRTAPVLFPIVGKLTNNTTLIDGQPYQLTQHGFARDQLFACIEQRDDFLLFKLQADEHSRRLYPFDFELSISYSLRGKDLSVGWHVSNTSRRAMPFSIGAHPAFSTELVDGDRFEDYDIVFDQHRQYWRWRLNDAMQLVSEAVAFQQPLQRFALDYRLFDNDALVFPQQQLQRITLKHRRHGHGVSVAFSGFPVVALWTADSKNKRSPFLCIEPWFGHADVEGGSPALQDKQGVIVLAPGEHFEAHYTMSFF